MSLGDVFAFFGGLLSLGLALPGLLVGWTLVCPAAVERARERLDRTPWRCFWLGVAGLVGAGLPILIALNVKAGPVQFLGWLGLITLLTVTSLGAAGLAALMGARLRAGGLAASPAGATLRAAGVLELALVFPVIGWFMLLPLTIICSLGAATFALPRLVVRPAVLPVAPEASHAPHPS